MVNGGSNGSANGNDALENFMRALVGHNSLRAEVVTSMEQLVQVFALRSLGYMEETVMPFDHAYDGNDLQATHLIAYHDCEPVGTMRIRSFTPWLRLRLLRLVSFALARTLLGTTTRSFDPLSR